MSTRWFGKICVEKNRLNLQSEKFSHVYLLSFIECEPGERDFSRSGVESFLTGEPQVKMIAKKSDRRHLLQLAHDLHSSLFLFLHAMPTRRFGQEKSLKLEIWVGKFHPGMQPNKT